MKKLISILLVLALCSAVFAQSLPIDPTLTVNKGLDSFAESLANTIPASSGTIGTWNDAYIGQLLAIPPHLGVGASVGLTKLDVTGIKSAASSLKIPAIPSLPDNLVFPTYSIDAIVGGLILPFDLSAFVTYIPEGKLNFKSLQLTNLSYGAKIRLPLLKENILLPGLSIGVGYSANTGKLEAGDTSKNIAVSYNTTVYSAEAQLSKSFILVTPYVGARVLASKSENTYDWNLKTSVPGIAFAGNGSYVTPLNTDENIPEFAKEFQIDTQIYGGISFNIAIINISANAAYDLLSKMWSGSLAVHLKI